MNNFDATKDAHKVYCVIVSVVGYFFNLVNVSYENIRNREVQNVLLEILSWKVFAVTELVNLQMKP